MNNLILLLFAASTSVALGPKTTIEEFIQGPGPDKSTLIVECANGRRIEIILSNKFIKERNVDTIFNKLIHECEK